MTYLKMKNRLRISLTKKESEKLFGRLDGLDKNDPYTTFALKALLKKAVKEQEFSVCGSVWVEVLRNRVGGYDVFFSKNKPVVNYTSVAVLEFENLENLISATKAINFCGPSRLYKYFGCYRLVFCYNEESKVLPMALEFADRFLTDVTDTAKTMEHGTVLIKENVFEVLRKT